MRLPSQSGAALCLSLAAPLLAQTSTPPLPAPRPYFNHNLVFLDAAHGGDDLGAHLDARTAEKDATIALALRIRALLVEGGLTVLMAREPEAPPSPATPDGAAPPPPPAIPTPDQRAGAANHVHPLACVLLHATAAGTGVHVVTSPLPPPDAAAEPVLNPVIPWNSAQRSSLPQSTRLAIELSDGLTHAGLTNHRSQASVRPIDSLTCPAVAVELAPLNGVSPADPRYQQRVAQAISTTLLFWRGHADPVAPAGAEP